ncbi:MAG: hypothetical protein KC636_15065, partial [Myxococcales bacterium]|nr:hypothetical protein [Myxococcales bacterium]
MILVGCRAPATTATPKVAPAASCQDACACGVDDDVAALIRCGDGPAALDVQAHALLEAPSVATTLGLVEIAWTFELDASARALLERLPALSTERYLGLGLLDLHAYVGAREDPRFEAAEGNLRRALASEEARQHALAGIVLLYLARGGGPGPELDRAGLLCRQNLATAAALASACARIAYARDEPALGRERYQQAIELDPHHYAAWLALGQAEL